MKNNVMLICGCLEAGKDGVGDYTTTLANALQNYATVSIVAINDAFVNEPLLQNVNIKTYRLPKRYSWAEKELLLSAYINANRPDWISLQLVTFGLNDRGIIKDAINPLKNSIGQIPLHLMLHELWIGEEIGARFKSVVCGKIIKFYFLQLIRKLRPYSIYVNCEVNKFLLSRYNIKSEEAPVFSNIPFLQNAHKEQFIASVNNAILIDFNFREYFVGGFFGTIHPEWDAEEGVNSLEKCAANLGKKLLVVFFGRVDRGQILRVKLLFASDTRVVDLGVGELSTISQYIQCCDLGITSNPEILVYKSGSVAAFLAHNKPVLITRNDLHVKGFTPSKKINSLILHSEDLTPFFENNAPLNQGKENFTAECLAERITEAMESIVLT